MKKIIALLVVTLISYFLITPLYNSGVFKTITAQSKLSDITIINSMAGTEDLDIDTGDDLLFISSADRWKTIEDSARPLPKDGIYLVELNSNTQPQLLATDYELGFHPHGISYLKQDGKKYLFVVNHNQQGDSVELFEYIERKLMHMQTFKTETLCCPNDLVAVSLNQFYVTNDHGVKTGMMRMAEDYLGIARSSVIYFDGTDYQTVIENLNYANGVNISNDGRTLFVTETTGGNISVYDRDIKTGDLQFRFVKSLQSGLDNITIDANDNLWIGSHPKVLAFVNHAKNTGKLSPSQVLKLTLTGDNDFNVEEIYLDMGEQLSGSSTALYYKGVVYVGVVFESKLLVGRYNP